MNNEQFEHLIRLVTSQLHTKALAEGATLMVERSVGPDNSILPVITIAMDFTEVSPEIVYTEEPFMQEKLLADQSTHVRLMLWGDGRIVYTFQNQSLDILSTGLMSSSATSDYVEKILGDLRPVQSPVTSGFIIKGSYTVH